MRKSTAYFKVVTIRGRYFTRFGKGGSVITAWSILGAKQFSRYEHDTELKKVCKRLDKKKIAYDLEDYAVTPVDAKTYQFKAESECIDL